MLCLDIQEEIDRKIINDGSSKINYKLLANCESKKL